MLTRHFSLHRSLHTPHTYWVTTSTCKYEKVLVSQYQSYGKKYKIVKKEKEWGRLCYNYYSPQNYQSFFTILRRLHPCLLLYYIVKHSKNWQVTGSFVKVVPKKVRGTLEIDFKIKRGLIITTVYAKKAGTWYFLFVIFVNFSL